MLKLSPIFFKKTICKFLKKRFYHVACDKETSAKYIEFCGNWVSADKNQFLNDMIVEENFLSKNEEIQLFDEIEPYLKRLRYEFDHWDDVCMTILHT